MLLNNAIHYFAIFQAFRYIFIPLFKSIAHICYIDNNPGCFTKRNNFDKYGHIKSLASTNISVTILVMSGLLLFKDG